MDSYGFSNVTEKPKEKISVLDTQEEEKPYFTAQPTAKPPSFPKKRLDVKANGKKIQR